MPGAGSRAATEQRSRGGASGGVIQSAAVAAR